MMTTTIAVHGAGSSESATTNAAAPARRTADRALNKLELVMDQFQPTAPGCIVRRMKHPARGLPAPRALVV